MDLPARQTKINIQDQNSKEEQGSGNENDNDMVCTLITDEVLWVLPDLYSVFHSLLSSHSALSATATTAVLLLHYPSFLRTVHTY